ncbi:hypothetical protein [Bacteroides pyogenes]|uniref:hypothetical protein n=1 Tax=Bacteroides pyogenes TaxID=310300 RepID=UPI002FDA10B9
MKKLLKKVEKCITPASGRRQRGGSLFSKIRGQQISKIKNSYVLPDIFSFLVVILKKNTILFVCFQKYTHICIVIRPVTYEVTDKKSDY